MHTLTLISPLSLKLYSSVCGNDLILSGSVQITGKSRFENSFSILEIKKKKMHWKFKIGKYSIESTAGQFYHDISTPVNISG